MTLQFVMMDDLNKENVLISDLTEGIRKRATELSYVMDDTDWPGANYERSAGLKLERKHAAVIVHEFLLEVMHEKDEKDIKAADRLEDLYECRACASHVAQVYCKGIIKAKYNNFKYPYSAFCLNEGITRVELQEIITKIFNFKTRVIPTYETEGSGIELVDKQTAISLADDLYVHVIDIRSRAEYELGHMKNATCVPLDELIRNPYIFTDKVTHPVLLYCTEHERSMAAAECLAEAGFDRIYIFNDKYLS